MRKIGGQTSGYWAASLVWAAFLGVACHAQRVSATVHVRFADGSATASAESPLVVWLSPLEPAVAPQRPATIYKMAQKNKQFVPHLLVVPVGSSVEFPNLDPFFHNVFSLFNGRRFDLGLYQAGPSQAVRISREGVSYIFCNIHPEMGGIILSLATPYYTVAEVGDVAMRNVPQGTYRMGLWSEHATTESLNAAARTVTVTAQAAELGTVTLQPLAWTKHPHRNKYGDPYPPEGPEGSLGRN